LTNKIVTCEKIAEFATPDKKKKKERKEEDIKIKPSRFEELRIQDALALGRQAQSFGPNQRAIRLS
jgi:hypothetical protein